MLSLENAIFDKKRDSDNTHFVIALSDKNF